MKNILMVIWEWRFVIILLVAAGLYCMFRWEQAKKIIYAGIAQAKRMAKDAVLKNGKEQEEWVVRMALQRLPLALRLVIGEQGIRDLIRTLYSKLGDYLDDGTINNSYKVGE